MTVYADLTFEHAGGDGGWRQSTQVLVMHATDNTASDESEASYAEHRADQTSAHFYNDSDSVIQALDTHEIAYGCLWHGNQISVQMEMVGLSNGIADDVLRRVAPVVARVCKDYDIPIRKISASDIRAGVRGIVGHADITAAFPQDLGTHTDPGDRFPWDTFIGYVLAAANPTAAPPAPHHEEEVEMFAVPKAVAFNADGGWRDPHASVPVPLFAVGTGPGQWGDAWVKLLSNGPAKVRVIANGDGYKGVDLDLDVARDTLVPLPAGTTAVYVGRVDGDPLTADVNASHRYDR